MSSIINIEALKKISSVLIDFQHIHKLGLEIFNHEGEVTDKIIQSCGLFNKSCEDLIAGTHDLKTSTSSYIAEKPNGDNC
jgi:hypothetical protein